MFNVFAKFYGMRSEETFEFDCYEDAFEYAMDCVRGSGYFAEITDESGRVLANFTDAI